MNSSGSQLPPAGAWAMGLLFVLAGLVPLLAGLGVLMPTYADPDTAPRWVLVCAGLMFAVAGLVIVVDYGIAGGMAPDGDLRAGTPVSIRVANLALGLTILGLMTAIFGWIAFGPGPRHFSTTFSVPFLPAAQAGRISAASGRIVFGGATVLLALMFAVCGVLGVARLRRARGGS